MKRLVLIGAVIAAIIAFFAFDLNQYLSLDALKQGQEKFQNIYAANPAVVLGSFFAIYVLVTALSLPGAAIMTLAAGALFGLVTGTILVSFASSIGATLAFLASRFLFRDAVKNKFGERIKKIDEGVEREGGFYLFAMRLVPAFPFFVINLVMGLTSLKTWTFYWVSQIGMLAGTIVYVNAGTQLAEVQAVGDVLSIELIGSFVLLGLFPLIAKKIVELVKARKVYKGYSEPPRFDRNMIVIGAGAAGLVSSLIAATVKAKVTLVESHKMGGDCLNYGCVPSKALIRAAKAAKEARTSDRFGIRSTEPEIDFSRVMEHVNGAVTAIEPHDSVERYTDLGVDVRLGYAKIIDPWTVEIAKDGSTERLTARSIVIAAGAEPFVPPLDGIEDSGYLTSDTLWEHMTKRGSVPERLVVMGGGPIGAELSQSFARLGAKVTLVEMADTILNREDEEVVELAAASLEADGVDLKTGHKAVACGSDDDGRFLEAEGPDGKVKFHYDELLVAVGRKARLSGYGLDEMGIETQRTIVADEYLQTKFPNILVAGDVVGPYQFTHTASHTAWYAAVNGLFGTFKRFKVDYSVIPAGTFIDPEVARVGLNEKEATEKEVEYEVTRYDLDDLDRAIADGETKGFVKVLTPPGKDRILGATIVGNHAADLLAEFVLAMKQGLGLNKILGTIHTYPTMSEATKFAAGEWKKAHKPDGVLRFLEKFHAWRRG